MGVIGNNLANNEYKQAYLLYGSESYLRIFYKNALKKALVSEGDNLNYSYYEGAGIDPDEVAGLLDTMPFMAKHRVVIVENSGWFGKTGKSDEESEENQDAAAGGKLAKLIDTIKNLPEESVIIFVEEKADKRSKIYKAVLAKGVCEEFAEQTDDQLAKWVYNYAKSAGKSMDSQTAYYLVSECGRDMITLGNEMEKLIAWCLERESITIEDINYVCSHQINNKIFDMIAAIAMHKQKEALKLYYDLLTLRESPFHILSLMVRQYTQMLAIKDGLLKNVPTPSIAAKLGIQDWLAKKVADQVRRMNIDEIKRNLSACAKADEDIKNGNLTDMMSVELLIVSCAIGDNN